MGWPYGGRGLHVSWGMAIWWSWAACELGMTIWWSWDACELRDGLMLAMGEPWVVCELWDGHMVVMGES